MGLGAVTGSNATYLSVAGGFIWDRKKGSDDPHYAEQTFIRADKTEGKRAGAQYASLTGKVVGVQFRTHDEYGESINVTVDTSDGNRYILSISTNNRYSQDMMKALLKGDISKPFFIKPYDFVGQDKKRAQGISFKQDGQKLNLRVETPDSFTKEKEWFKSATKKQIKRFFEDLSDWFVAEVEEKVCSKLSADLPELEQEPQGLGASTGEVQKPIEEPKVEAEKVEKPKVTPVKMRKAIKAYIEENYPEQEMPKLSKEDLVKWYDLVEQEEELPFEEDKAEVAGDDLDNELDNLLGSN